MSPRNQLEAFANHSTTTFVLHGGQNMTALALNDIAALQLLQAKNMTAILYSVQSVFGSQAKLSSNYSAQWDVYWKLVEPYSASILAFSPADEPTQAQVGAGIYGTMCKFLKEKVPHIPILAVVTPSATVGIEMGSFDLPKEVDWIGMDNCAQPCALLGAEACLAC